MKACTSISQPHAVVALTSWNRPTPMYLNFWLLKFLKWGSPSETHLERVDDGAVLHEQARGAGSLASGFAHEPPPVCPVGEDTLANGGGGGGWTITRGGGGGGGGGLKLPLGMHADCCALHPHEPPQ